MTDPSSPEPSRRVSLGFREAIGVFVAFATVGTILFWSLLQEEVPENQPAGVAPEMLFGVPTASPTPELPATTAPEAATPIPAPPVESVAPESSISPADPGTRPDSAPAPTSGNLPVTSP